MIPSNLAIGNSARLQRSKKRWADLKFKTQAKAFLAKFVDGLGRPIECPSLLCRRRSLIDGTSPSTQEIEALTAAIAFAFLDKNPRLTSLTSQQSWRVVTTDNTEPFFWPIDLGLRRRNRYDRNNGQNQ